MSEFFVQNAGSSQTLIFALVISALWGVEKLVLAEPMADKSRHAALNSLFILSALPIELVCSVACVALAAWVTAHHWGLLYLLPFYDSPWVKYGVMFVVLDLLDYVYHRTMHHIPGFWRFHLVHHTDTIVDASTTVREHPGETTIRNGFLFVWILLTGASFEVLVLRQTVQTICTIFAHSAFRLPAGPARVLGWVLITPNLHHVHHHFELPYTNCNYGDVFSIWDRLFGTFANLSAEETVFGLDTHFDDPATQNCIGMIAMPFAARAAGGAVPEGCAAVEPRLPAAATS
ncbi:sterol desaturase family protein [Beijerinckia sp. L45]|uniref:sterol desaturase family protein n=1 Tax=Beijerinckia sp. L45 TaxID=1641855 RepID=UPI00131D930C|nr:sterol desaturase family protein [Beijerinckia sp. L45]